jgi:hypothetical protein
MPGYSVKIAQELEDYKNPGFDLSIEYERRNRSAAEKGAGKQ